MGHLLPPSAGSGTGTEPVVTCCLAMDSKPEVMSVCVCVPWDVGIHWNTWGSRADTGNRCVSELRSPARDRTSWNILRASCPCVTPSLGGAQGQSSLAQWCHQGPGSFCRGSFVCLMSVLLPSIPCSCCPGASAPQLRQDTQGHGV